MGLLYFFLFLCCSTGLPVSLMEYFIFLNVSFCLGYLVPFQQLPFQALDSNKLYFLQLLEVQLNRTTSTYLLFLDLFPISEQQLSVYFRPVQWKIISWEMLSHFRLCFATSFFLDTLQVLPSDGQLLRICSIILFIQRENAVQLPDCSLLYSL